MYSALSYGMRSQGISQFYLHTPCTSANGMNLTCLCDCFHRSFSLSSLIIIIIVVHCSFADMIYCTVLYMSENLVPRYDLLVLFC